MIFRSNSTADSSTSSATAANDRPATQATIARRKSSSQLPKPQVPSQICIECKQHEAIPNAVYCSNICLIKHVNNSLTAMNNAQDHPLSEEQKIIVVDKKRDHRITGLSPKNSVLFWMFGLRSKRLGVLILVSSVA